MASQGFGMQQNGMMPPNGMMPQSGMQPQNGMMPQNGMPQNGMMPQYGMIPQNGSVQPTTYNPTGMPGGTMLIPSSIEWKFQQLDNPNAVPDNPTTQNLGQFGYNFFNNAQVSTSLRSGTSRWATTT